MKKNSTWSIRELIFITLVGIIFSSLYAVYLGQDIGPDLVNYHFYSGYLSYNKHRLLTDVIPANIQGYLNPYIYFPYFFLYKIFPPILVSAIIGGIHGLCFISIYLVARINLNHWPPHKARLASLLCAVFGLINPFYLSMLGASWSDNLTPILILSSLAILIYIKFPADNDSKKATETIINKYIALVCAGLLIGFSVGFKLTNAAFVIGLIPAWLVGLNFSVTRSVVKKYLEEFISTFGGIIIGFLIINGSWMWSLWSNFQNPLFPFYNGFFKSKKIINIWTNVPAVAGAKNIGDYFTYPFNWALGIPPESEWVFRDLRFSVVYILFFLFIIYRIVLACKFNLTVIAPVRFRTPNYIINRWRFLSIWVGFSYLFWINQFGALRYLMPITLLTGLLIFLLINNFIREKNITLGVFVIISTLCLITIKLPPFGRLPWDQSWYPVKLPETIAKNPAIYLNRDYSFVIPFFPKESRFFGYLYLNPKDNFTRSVRNEIMRQSMPMRTLTASRWTPLDDAKLEMLSLRRNPFDCVTFEAGWAKYETCSAEKISPGISPILLPDFLNIDFSKTHLSGVSNGTGFDSPEPEGSWSVGPVAETKLVGNLPAKFKLVLTAYAFARNSETGINLIIGEQKKKIVLGNTMVTKEIPYIFESSSKAGSLIRFEIPHPTSPSEVDKSSTDIRKLGIFIKSLHIISAWPKTIDFSNINSQSDLKEVSGFSIQEPFGRWTEGVESSLTFDEPLPASFKLSLRASTLPTNIGKSVAILVGKSRYTFKLSDIPKDYELDITLDPSNVYKMVFEIPFSISPKEIGLNADTRRLGIFIEKIKITALEK